eukprot:365366-Chlamydomonas_euryale.AAC.12
MRCMRQSSWTQPHAHLGAHEEVTVRVAGDHFHGLARELSLRSNTAEQGSTRVTIQAGIHTRRIHVGQLVNGTGAIPADRRTKLGIPLCIRGVRPVSQRSPAKRVSPYDVSPLGRTPPP